MAKASNQHWIPQFYFRMFSGGTPKINLLIKDESRVILNAPIKGQSARRGFYGSEATEKGIAAIESQHAIVLKQCIQFARVGSLAGLSTVDHRRLCDAALFQRSRTQLELNKQAPAMEVVSTLALENYCLSLKTAEEKAAAIRIIESGQISTAEPREQALSRAMSVAIEHSKNILDLGIKLFRNQTELPFVFGDSPVIFFNQYGENIADRGVLGVKNPGIQIFWPLNSKLMLLLIDEAKYRGEGVENPVFDITKPADIRQLNVLQFHHSNNIIYFGDPTHAESVEREWNREKLKVMRPEISIESRPDLTVRGRSKPDKLVVFFEKQLNIKLRLSFLTCIPAAPNQFGFRR
jgi:Protein of unknown function (DUF4238)